MALGHTAMNSMLAAIANGGKPENSPYRDDPDFEKVWAELSEFVASLEPGQDIYFSSD